MSYRRQRAEEDAHARRMAYCLPGEYAKNLVSVMRIRAERVRKMREQGFNSAQIFEMHGLTYTQQWYATRWEDPDAI